jgi:hypothetical protein
MRICLDMYLRVMRKGSVMIQSHPLEASPRSSVVPYSYVWTDPISSHSGSDYGQHRDEQISKRAKDTARGKSVSDTQSDDDHVDNELEGDATTDSYLGKGKGKKARKMGVNKGYSYYHGEEQGGDESESWTKISGQLSKAGKKEAADLGRHTLQKAAQIGRKYGKGTRDIMQHAGLTLRTARSPNSANKFRTWYSCNHPKAKDGEFIYLHDNMLLKIFTFTSII